MICQEEFFIRFLASMDDNQNVAGPNSSKNEASRLRLIIQQSVENGLVQIVSDHLAFRRKATEIEFRA